MSPDRQAVVQPRAPLYVRVLESLAIALVAAYAIFLVVADAADGPSLVFDRFVYIAALLLPGVLCLTRAARVETERLAWTLLGLNLVLWAIGEAYWGAMVEIEGEAPYPALSDAIILAAYPLAFAGVALLARDRVRRFRRLTWLDGAIAGLVVTAFGAGFVMPTITDALTGDTLADAVTVAYPIADTMLLGFLACVLILVGWRFDPSWALIAASLAILPIADSVYSYQAAAGTYVEGGLLDLMYPLSAALLGLAAWRRRSTVDQGAAVGWRSIATPGVLTVAAGMLLVYGYAGDLSGVAVALAAAALLTATVRLVIIYRENQRLFERSHHDGLTGLGNRAALLLDLGDAFREIEGPPQYLAMFDLNNFKLYNDSFGHPAGDALLVQLAGRFADAIDGHGRAYRIGGDEFCALIQADAGEAQPLVSRAAAALSERGEAFEVTAAGGTASIGDEAKDPDAALQLADRRMYADKTRSSSSARSQAHEVLISVLRERQPELGDHVARVSELATGVASRMGVGTEELDVIARAAALHDIGKLAVPDTILEKPGPLDENERRFIRDHTIVGERILREAPALAPVAELVRSSHERWDGGGYPDGLSGEQIPLGARVIFVCDAFHAMTSGRSYAASVSVEAAVAELQRCAGTQFDPAVVEAISVEIATTPLPSHSEELLPD